MKFVRSLVTKLSHEAPEFPSDGFKNIKRRVGVHPELCERMPFCSLVQQPEEHSVEWLGEESLKNGDRTLITRVVILAIWATRRMSIEKINKSYLQDIFEITTRKFLHLRDIIMETPNGKTTKSRNLTKSVSVV